MHIKVRKENFCFLCCFLLGGGGGSPRVSFKFEPPLCIQIRSCSTFLLTYFSSQDKEPPILPSPTSLAFSGQTGSSSGDLDPLHLHQEKKAERGQQQACILQSEAMMIKPTSSSLPHDVCILIFCFTSPLHKYCIGSNLSPCIELLEVLICVAAQSSCRHSAAVQHYLDRGRTEQD